MRDYFNYSFSHEELMKMSSLGFAHIGDAVYELLVRAMMGADGKQTSKDLHKATVKFVSAPAQAHAAEKIIPYLNEEELSVFKRGRNAKVNSVPQHSSFAEYHLATALEALFGYLFLVGKKDRINELFAHIVEEE